MPAIATAQARRLKTKDPRIVKRYTEAWWETFILENNMLERTYRVQQACAYPLDPILQAETEALDALRIEGMMAADKNKCHKLATGAVPWSPIVQNHREIIELWGLILKKKEGKRVSICLLSRGMEKHHIIYRIRDHAFRPFYRRLHE
jgi:hypothetical protein